MRVPSREDICRVYCATCRQLTLVRSDYSKACCDRTATVSEYASRRVVCRRVLLVDPKPKEN